MSKVQEDINSIINRVATDEFNDADIAALRKMLDSGDRQMKLQLGKYNVNIGVTVPTRKNCALTDLENILNPYPD